MAEYTVGRRIDREMRFGIKERGANARIRSVGTRRCDNAAIR